MAEEEEEKGRGFKVQDRRRFSQEGELKPEHRGAEQESVRTAEPKASAQPKAQPGPGGEAESLLAAGAGAAYSAGEVTFASFIVGLSTEALALLGEMPHPATGERTCDLGGAQQIIDIIGLLREKTRGNLDHDEESLIDAILFDLRMKYVEIARQSAR
jgi:Domain of unknown function (DUF1844)